MGIIFDIQRFSTYDGPGIRTTVFLKGCMMRCPWCHNPESLSIKPQLSFVSDKCLMCGRCAEICPKVHSFVNGKHRVEFLSCDACGKCLEFCPGDCLSIFGREAEAEEVIAEVMKDEKYYKSSGGGVTFTGGEPTFQFEFLMELLRLSKSKNLNTCIETNGIISEPHLCELIPLVDTFLLDYKATGEPHKSLTLYDESLVIDTLECLEKAGAIVILRCPIIPGFNDSDEHFSAIRTLRKKYSCIKSAEIMAYHSSAIGKWDAIGSDYGLRDINTATKDMKDKWTEKIKI